jgi:hypothetical protein
LVVVVLAMYVLVFPDICPISGRHNDSQVWARNRPLALSTTGFSASRSMCRPHLGNHDVIVTDLAGGLSRGHRPVDASSICSPYKKENRIRGLVPPL